MAPFDVPISGTWSVYYQAAKRDNYCGKVIVELDGTQAGTELDAFYNSSLPIFDSWIGGVSLGSLDAGTRHTISLVIAADSSGLGTYVVPEQVMFVRTA